MLATSPSGADLTPGRAWFSLVVGTLLFLAPTILSPILGEPLGSALKGVGLLRADASDFLTQFTAALVLRWLSIVLLVIFVFAGEHQPRSSLGLRAPSLNDLLLAILVGVGTAAAALAVYFAVGGPKLSAGTETARVVAALDLPARIHLVVNAAVVEEFYFRGFLIERLTSATRRLWLAGTISFVLFVAIHLGASGVVQTATLVVPFAAALVLLYVRRRNLIACILAHAILDSPLLIESLHLFGEG